MFKILVSFIKSVSIFILWIYLIFKKIFFHLIRKQIDIVINSLIKHRLMIVNIESDFIIKKF